MSEEYNGWSNFETWSANLSLTNDEGLYNLCREYTAQACGGEERRSWFWRAGDAIKDMVETLEDEYAEYGEFGQSYHVIEGELSRFRIDWSEIGEGFAESYAEELEL
jgi:hypothetical protein